MGVIEEKPGGVEEEEAGEEEEEEEDGRGRAAYADNTLCLRNLDFHWRIYPAQCAGQH